MAACERELTLPESAIAAGEVHVAGAGEPRGMYRLIVRDGRGHLEDMFVARRCPALRYRQGLVGAHGSAGARRPLRMAEPRRGPVRGALLPVDGDACRGRERVRFDPRQDAAAHGEAVVLTPPRHLQASFTMLGDHVAKAVKRVRHDRVAYFPYRRSQFPHRTGGCVRASGAGGLLHLALHRGGKRGGSARARQGRRAVRRADALSKFAARTCQRTRRWEAAKRPSLPTARRVCAARASSCSPKRRWFRRSPRPWTGLPSSSAPRSRTRTPRPPNTAENAPCGTCRAQLWCGLNRSQRLDLRAHQMVCEQGTAFDGRFGSVAALCRA